MPPHFHAVQFYREPAFLCRTIAEFVAEGLRAGDPAIVIATAGHRASIQNELRERGFDVELLMRATDLVMSDVRAGLAEFMIDGMPHPGAVKHLLGNSLEQVCRGRAHCTPRVYGEMANILWKDGLPAAALRLEELGNEVLATHNAKILCGYSMGNFYKGTAFDAIKGLHTHAVNESGEFAAIG
jgi:hypothetical protein